MLKGFKLEINVTIESEAVDEFDVVKANLNLLPEMAENFDLFTQGSMAKLVDVSSKLREVRKQQRTRRKKTKRS